MRVGRQGVSIQKQKEAKRSQTGTRTRVCWVRASYPNHLDYLGSSEHTRHTHKHKHKQNNTHAQTHKYNNHSSNQHIHTPYARFTPLPAHSHLHTLTYTSPRLLYSALSLASLARPKTNSFQYDFIRSDPNQTDSIRFLIIPSHTDPTRSKRNKMERNRTK